MPSSLSSAPLPAPIPSYSSVVPVTIGAVHAMWHVLGIRRTLLEVKNVVCADYPQGGVPPGRPAVGVYTAPAEGYEAKALFPHGAAKPKIKVFIRRLFVRISCLLRFVVLVCESSCAQPPVGCSRCLTGRSCDACDVPSTIRMTNCRWALARRTAV